MPPLGPPDNQTVDRIVDHLQKCRSILFVTGAGMSAESGLPTYRGVGGLYNSGETTEGFAIEEMLSGEMFRTRPEWTWKYLRQIEEACRGATFNRRSEERRVGKGGTSSRVTNKADKQE